MSLTYCTRCKKKGLTSPAIGFIPSISVSDEIDPTIFLCEIHFDEAVEKCFYVLMLGQDSDAGAFDKKSWAKHVKIRGTRRLKYENGSQW